MLYKKHIAAGLSYVPIYSELTGLELKPSTVIRARRPDQSYIPELVGSASAGGLSHLQKLMGILGKEKMGILLKVSHQSQTAFHAACRKNHVAVMEFIYTTFGCDLENRCGRYLHTPLLEAVSGEAIDAIKWLLEHGASKDASSKYGNTSYSLAEEHKLTDVLNVLNTY